MASQARVISQQSKYKECHQNENMRLPSRVRSESGGHGGLVRLNIYYKIFDVKIVFILPCLTEMTNGYIKDLDLKNVPLFRFSMAE